MTKKADTLHRSNLCNYCKQELFTGAALNGLMKVLKKLKICCFYDYYYYYYY